MSLSDKGLTLGRALVEKAFELGINIQTATSKQLSVLFPILPQDLVDAAIATAPKEIHPDDILAVFVQLLVSQLPEQKIRKSVASWGKKKRPVH